MIIPITGKISLRNPPVITLLLILVNTIIFFAFQARDNEKYIQAREYYFSSGLAEIEIRHYLIYSESKGASPKQIDFESLDEDTLSSLFIKMQSDKAFREELEGGHIIGPDDEDYSRWKELKDTFIRKLHETVAHQFGFIPSDVRPVSVISHMFLHGSFSHLFGNMVFLWLVGCILEMGCGRLMYTIWYLLGGMAAVGFFWSFNMQSHTPLVGASGAIAGLMGLVTVLYGLKRIKVFLTLGFYFDYFKMRGIFLLPIWVFKEVISEVAYGDASGVAYMAHAGGLLGGAALGFINLKLIGLHNETVFDEEPEDKISPLMEAALHAIEQLDFDQARMKLNEILTLEPGNRTALSHLFHIEKLTPGGGTFHRITEKLLSLLCSNPQTYPSAKEIFNEYMALTPKPKLSPGIFLKMISVFLGSGETDRSEIMLKTLLKQRPNLEGITTVLLKTVQTFENKGDRAKADYFRQLLLMNYPDSREAMLIKSR